MPKRKVSSYVENEAAHSGNDTSEGESVGSQSDDSMVCDDNEVEYEDDASSREEEHRISENQFQKTQKKIKARKSDSDKIDKELMASAIKQKSKLVSPEIESSENEKDEKVPEKKIPVKLASNKTHNEADIPPKPKTFGLMRKKGSNSRKYVFRASFTNGAMFHKFLLPIANAVHEIRFNLTSTPDFTGIRLEAHDTYLTLASKSRYECDIEGGFSLDGTPLSSAELTGMSFCVTASNFMLTLGCTILKDTVLTITKYVDSPDTIIFESLTNENDVQTVYSCDLLAESRLESMKGMSFSLGYHVNIYLKTLKEQTVNAKKCGASTIFFALYQAEDEADANIVHSKLSVGFKGIATSGSHDFYQSARKIERENESGGKVTEFQALSGLSLSQRQSIELKRVSYNE